MGLEYKVNLLDEFDWLMSEKAAFSYNGSLENFDPARYDLDVNSYYNVKIVYPKDPVTKATETEIWEDAELIQSTHTMPSHTAPETWEYTFQAALK